MRIVPALAIAALPVVLLLNGCVPPDPVVTASPAPSATPAFASDEEALDAATKAYAAYVTMSDQIFNAGGASSERMKAVAVGAQLDADLQGFAKAAANVQHSIGATKFDSVTLQQYLPNSRDGFRAVVLYLCEDVSEVDVVDSNGNSIVSPSRPARTAYEVSLDAVPKDSNQLLVSQKELWTEGQC